jgi:hypothetical protein
MAVLRFLAALFALISVITFVADFTHAREGNRPFEGTALLDYWEALSPSTLQSSQASVTNSIGPTGWAVLAGALGTPPAYGVFGAAALLCGYAGRRRRQIKVFVN